MLPLSALSARRAHWPPRLRSTATCSCMVSRSPSARRTFNHEVVMLLWLSLVVSLLVALPPASIAQLRGTIFGPGTKAFPVAVTELQTGGGEKPSARQFADIVTWDLTM